MKLSKVFHKLLSTHIVICILLAGIYVFKNLISGFEYTENDWFMFFSMTGIVLYNLKQDVRKKVHIWICGILCILSVVELGYVLINQMYSVVIILFGQIIPSALYLLIYYTESTESTDEEIDEEWDKLWADIYAFNNELPSELLEDLDHLEELGLYVTYGKEGEKLYINKDLCHRLFLYRNKH